MSQASLAKEINLSRSTLAKYEIGERIPDLVTLGKLAAVFSIGLEELTGIKAPGEIVREIQKRYGSQVEGIREDLLEQLYILKENTKLQEVLVKLLKTDPKRLRDLIKVIELLIEMK